MRSWSAPVESEADYLVPQHKQIHGACYQTHAGTKLIYRASGLVRRRYGDAELARLRFIRSAQNLGFSLDEIAELLKLEDGTHCGEARQLAEVKLRDVRERLSHLRRIESALRTLVAGCSSARGSVKCPLISSLRGP